MSLEAPRSLIRLARPFAAAKARPEYYGAAVSTTSDRIRAVIGELQEIQSLLESERPPEEAPTDTAAVADLKNYLDNLRHFVWAYLEAQEQQSGDIDSTLQNYRMKRVAEMLRALRAQLDEIEPSDAPDAPSFFKELMLSAEAVYDKNLAQYKKPES